MWASWGWVAVQHSEKLFAHSGFDFDHRVGPREIGFVAAARTGMLPEKIAIV